MLEHFLEEHFSTKQPTKRYFLANSQGNNYLKDFFCKGKQSTKRYFFGKGEQSSKRYFFGKVSENDYLKDIFWQRETIILKIFFWQRRAIIKNILLTKNNIVVVGRSGLMKAGTLTYFFL